MFCIYAVISGSEDLFQSLCHAFENNVLLSSEPVGAFWKAYDSGKETVI